MENYTKQEKESIINFNQEDETASFYTCDEGWMRKLDKLAKEDPRITVEKRDEHSGTYIIPKKAVKVRLSRVLLGEELKKRRLQAQSNLHKKGK